MRCHRTSAASQAFIRENWAGFTFSFWLLEPWLGGEAVTSHLCWETGLDPAGDFVMVRRVNHRATRRPNNERFIPLNETSTRAAAAATSLTLEWIHGDWKLLLFYISCFMVSEELKGKLCFLLHLSHLIHILGFLNWTYVECDIIHLADHSIISSSCCLAAALMCSTHLLLITDLWISE